MSADRRVYFKELKVKYGDSSSDAPPDALRELTGLSNNLNHRYGGKHVWLVPVYTINPKEALTSFDLIVQSKPDPKNDDLGKGAGGGYRYLFSRADSNKPDKITYAALLRSDSGLASTPPPPGWDIMSMDLNKGRRKSYLYIVAKTIAYSRRSLLSVPNAAYLSVKNSTASKQYIQCLTVRYGDHQSEMPLDSIRELNGGSADINDQCGGKCVWLVPSYTTDPTKAVTSFEVHIQSWEDTKQTDLAKGAGGDFRYVTPRMDRKSSEKVIQVGLFRSEGPVEGPPNGWNGIATPDLGQGRQKEYLYLVWRTASTNSWSFVSLASINPFMGINGGNQYVKSLRTCYGDEPSEMPPDALYEYNGRSSDINYQFGGKYVWLVPEYTTDSKTAATAFESVVQNSSDSTYADLAKGAGGDFRYVVPRIDLQSRAKVKEVVLLRTDEPIVQGGGGPQIPAGWSGITRDMNVGRKKTYLYVMWKTVTV